MTLGIFSLFRHKKLVSFPCLMSAIIHPGGTFQFAENPKEQRVIRSILFNSIVIEVERTKQDWTKGKSILTCASLWELWFWSSLWYSLLWKLPSSLGLSPVSHMTSFESGSDVNLTRVLQMKQSLKLMTAKYGCCWLHFNSWGKNQTGNQDVTSHWCPQVLIYLEKVKTSFVQSVKKNVLNSCTGSLMVSIVDIIRNRIWSLNLLTR